MDPAAASPYAGPSARARLFLNLSAFGLLGFSLGGTWLMLEPDRFLVLQGLAVATFVTLGKFVVLLPVWDESTGFSPFFLASMVSVMDVITSLVVVANLGLLYRLRWVGAKLHGLEANGRRMLSQRPWMRRLAVFGVVVFVMFPLTGTGAVGGTLFGRLIGLRFPRILLGILSGALLGSFGLAFGADALGDVLGEVRESWWFRAMGIAVLACFVGTLVWHGLRTRAADPVEP